MGNYLPIPYLKKKKIYFGQQHVGALVIISSEFGSSRIKIKKKNRDPLYNVYIVKNILTTFILISSTTQSKAQAMSTKCFPLDIFFILRNLVTKMYYKKKNNFIIEKKKRTISFKIYKTYIHKEVNVISFLFCFLFDG